MHSSSRGAFGLEPAGEFSLSCSLSWEAVTCDYEVETQLTANAGTTIDAFNHAVE